MNSEVERANATLPRELETTFVGTMRLGETRYALPGAMYADRNRDLWLYTVAEVRIESGEGFSMRIELAEDGYHVWADLCHTYDIRQARPGGEVQNVRPVHRLHLELA